MIWLIKFLIFGPEKEKHQHKWKIISENEIRGTKWIDYNVWTKCHIYDENNNVKKGTKYTLQCETCGDIKHYSTKDSD